VPSTISVLKEICTASKQKKSNCEVFVDSGITRGTDVMKCLALGANGVFINRPLMWALYKDGEEGCTSLMTLLNEELKLAMALTCCFNLADITEEQVIWKSPSAKL